MSEENKNKNNKTYNYFVYNRMFYIVYIMLSMYALYISLQCHNEIISFETLIALVFPVLYIPLRLYTKNQCSFNKNIGSICFA